MKPKLSELTLREKIGQTALIASSTEGFTEVSNNPYGGIWSRGNLFTATVNLKEQSVGNRITTKNFCELLKKMNSEMKVPILPAMDCIFGIHNAFNEIEFVMDAPIIGATGNENLAYKTGKCRVESLKAAGSM